MVGVVLILLALFVVGPIAVFFGGGVWSAVVGWLSSEDADAQVAASDGQESASA